MTETSVTLSDAAAKRIAAIVGAEAGKSALRVSVGLATSDEDIALFRKALAGIVARRAASDRAA